MTKNQQQVYDLLRDYGPLPDQAMVPLAQHMLMLHQSSSGLRSRRAELVEMGFVEADGAIKLPSGRNAITWSASLV